MPREHRTRFRLSSVDWPALSTRRKHSFAQISQNARVFYCGETTTTSHLPNVKNNRSPMSPSPGLIIPRSLSSLSIPPIQISVPSAHSSAAFMTPTWAPRMLIRITRSAPHSLSVCIAAAAVPPVAITGSRSSARLAAAVFAFGCAAVDVETGRAKGKLL